MRFLASLILIFWLVNNVFPCTVEISTIKTNAVYGKVIAETQESIPNAVIQIYKNKEEGIEIIAETKADENGRFEIKNFPAGKYMIRANAEHFTYSYASMKLKKTSAYVRNKEIIITLVPHGDCSGWVEMKKIQKSK